MKIKDIARLYALTQRLPPEYDEAVFCEMVDGRVAVAHAEHRPLVIRPDGTWTVIEAFPAITPPPP